jgi:uncharacterized membrane protein YfcA
MIESAEWVLVLVCFVGSIISVSIGTSCGLLFAALVTVLPPTTAIPIHGLIEGTSSGIRWAILRNYLNYRYLQSFLIGGSLGLVIGWPLLGLFSEQTLKLILGLFLLATLWIPLKWLRLTAFMGGTSTSCLTVLVGATGPLVAALLARKRQGHRTLVSTQGACTLFQHWGKVLIFCLSGFSFSQHLSLVSALILATVIGTLSGKKLLSFIPASYLRIALKTVVTVLGLRMVLVGLNIPVYDTTFASISGVAMIVTLAGVCCYLGYQVGLHTKRR